MEWWEIILGILAIFFIYAPLRGLHSVRLKGLEENEVVQMVSGAIVFIVMASWAIGCFAADNKTGGIVFGVIAALAGYSLVSEIIKRRVSGSSKPSTESRHPGNPTLRRPERLERGPKP